MNTKNNRRRRKSVEAIEKAFFELLQDRELAQVTVSDICKMCRLNRSTFYANYLDIYDLADKVRIHLAEEVDRLYAAEGMGDFFADGFLKLFHHIRENQLFYQTYFKLGCDDRHRAILCSLIPAEQYFGGEYVHYHLTFFISGFNAMIQAWLAGGCRETPEEMRRIIYQEYQERPQAARRQPK